MAHERLLFSERNLFSVIYMILYILKDHLTQKISFKYINPRGTEEKGEGDGVARDVFTTFWQEVSDSLLIGEGFSGELKKILKNYSPFLFWKKKGEILGKIFLSF